jgi:hypothetical protein
MVVPLVPLAVKNCVAAVDARGRSEEGQDPINGVARDGI